MMHFNDKRCEGIENEYGWFAVYIGAVHNFIRKELGLPLCEEDEELTYVTCCLINNLFIYYMNAETSPSEVRKELEKLYKAQDKYFEILDRIHLMSDVGLAYFKDHGTELSEEHFKLQEKRHIRHTNEKKKRSFAYGIPKEWLNKWKQGKTVGYTKLDAKVVDAEPEHRTGSRRSEYNKDKLPHEVMLSLIELWFYLYDEEPRRTYDPATPSYKGKFKDFAEPIWDHFYEVIRKYRLAIGSRTMYSFDEYYKKWFATKYIYDEKYGRWIETKDKKGVRKRHDNLIPIFVEQFKQLQEDTKK